MRGIGRWLVGLVAGVSLWYMGAHRAGPSSQPSKTVTPLERALQQPLSPHQVWYCGDRYAWTYDTSLKRSVVTYNQASGEVVPIDTARPGERDSLRVELGAPCGSSR